ncbi:hypothetical protein ES703_123528 [subsurface metagenome]
MLDEEKQSLNDEIVQFILDNGAIKVGFATKETLAGGPPSTDITYLLSEAETVICFAVPLDKEKIRAFLRKDLPDSRMEHEKDNVEGYLKTISIAKKTANFLQEKGFKATEIISNFKYREEIPGWELKMYPELALRLIAMRSGAGSVGWSGNIGLKGYGAAIILGGLVTSAKLEPTAPIPSEDSFCNKCKLCTKVCGYGMFSEDEETSVTLGGYTFTYSKRINKLRCALVCGGINGLHKSGQWSTWSPGRYDYPEDDYEVNRLITLGMTTQPKRPLIKDHSKGYNPASYGDKGRIQLLKFFLSLIRG